MKSTKEFIHAFIVRIWIEPREKKDALPVWRGVIEHVEMEDVEYEKPVYFDHLDKLKSYFANYLQRLGIKLENYEIRKEQDSDDDVPEDFDVS
jgi:hypothetical protein